MIQTGVQFNLCRASKVSYFTAFSREFDAFYTSPSTSPACPTNIPSITNKSCDGVKEMMIQVGGHVNPYLKKMNKISRGVGGGRQPPPTMLFAEVMI